MSVITISRGSFSGGKQLAECLARTLNYRCIDRDVLTQRTSIRTVSPDEILAALDTPPKVDPLIEDFKKADAALSAEQRKPMGERDFASVTAAFKEIAEKTDKSYLKRATMERQALIKTL